MINEAAFYQKLQTLNKLLESEGEEFVAGVVEVEAVGGVFLRDLGVVGVESELVVEVENGEAIVISDSLLGKVGGYVVRVAEALCKRRLHSLRFIARVEVADEECGTVIFLTETLESAGQKIDLILARLVRVGQTVGRIGLCHSFTRRTLPPKVSGGKNEELTALLDAENADIVSLRARVVELALKAFYVVGIGEKFRIDELKLVCAVENGREPTPDEGVINGLFCHSFLEKISHKRA